MPACVGRSDVVERPEERHYRFGVVHDTGSYLRLLSTYSSHRVLDERTRERLFAAVAQLIDGEYGAAWSRGTGASSTSLAGTDADVVRLVRRRPWGEV